ncbi:hypothetical protein BN13_1080028 [Nostocoides jenkinsii Ben 74]|uniref:Uncharacterized protein n=1 Tax=Nostocoides jenkinsii Ben 74 TaxID=1193518 RepID=A0A077M6Y9_9MICO|nr:hypothetical protein BN13_1080028 [Tetrasphaera jenkinsii Ben 74]
MAGKGQEASAALVPRVEDLGVVVYRALLRKPAGGGSGNHHQTVCGLALSGDARCTAGLFTPVLATRRCTLTEGGRQSDP